MTAAGLWCGILVSPPTLASEGKTPPVPYDVDAFCADYFTKAEDFEPRHCSAEDREAAQAVQMLEAMIQSCRTSLGQAASSGRATFDAKQALACVAARARSKRPTREVLENACKNVVVGKRSRSQACSKTIECQPGLICVETEPGAQQRCVSPRARGAACEMGSGPSLEDFHLGGHPQCVPGSHCGMKDLGTCIPDVANGRPCKLDECSPWSECFRGKCVPQMISDAGQACSFDLQCNRGLYCRGLLKEEAVSEPPVCAARKGANETCHRGSECAGKCRSNRCVSWCGSR
jgi:hypothetical protein